MHVSWEMKWETLRVKNWESHLDQKVEIRYTLPMAYHMGMHMERFDK